VASFASDVLDQRTQICSALSALLPPPPATGVDLNASAACRAVVVTAVTPAARSWWEWLGFHPFGPDSLERYHVTSEIMATFGQLEALGGRP